MPKQKDNNAESKPGNLDINKLRDLINKKAGLNVACDSATENPAATPYFLSTGSTWLDCIICKGRRAGIPGGKVVEIAGVESSGKSFMAIQIAALAQKEHNITVVYFDSENALDLEFAKRAGCDMDNFLYIQAVSVEMVLETIEELLTKSDNKLLFIWDSISNTPTKTLVDSDNFDPAASVAMKARILSVGFSKLAIPLGLKQPTLTILSQIRDNIMASKYEKMIDPYYSASGGHAIAHVLSLKLWLTGRKSKDSYIKNDKGFYIGSEITTTIKKSRYGTLGRKATFKILWGTSDKIGIADEESIFEYLEIAGILEGGAAGRYHIIDLDGIEHKFSTNEWLEFYFNNKEMINNLIGKNLITDFVNQTKEAKTFYEIGEE